MTSDHRKANLNMRQQFLPVSTAKHFNNNGNVREDKRIHTAISVGGNKNGFELLKE